MLADNVDLNNTEARISGGHGMIVAAADPRRDGTGIALNASREMEIA